jgi:hypothetical protein
VWLLPYNRRAEQSVRHRSLTLDMSLKNLTGPAEGLRNVMADSCAILT